MPFQPMEKPSANVHAVALVLDRLDLVLVGDISDPEMMGTEDEAVDFVPELGGEAQQGGEGGVAVHAFDIVSTNRWTCRND